jgi:hypothetical protein
LDLLPIDLDGRAFFARDRRRHRASDGAAVLACNLSQHAIAHIVPNRNRDQEHNAADHQ